MEDKQIKIEKIVVNTEHELTDIVRNIHKSDAERIVITFTEQSDLLISPVNLKVIQETANKEGKLLIAQIIQNPTGVRNSRLAGIKVIETPTRPTEEDWEEAVILRENSRKKKDVPQTIKTPVSSNNDFEKRVNNVIDRSKNNNLLPHKDLDEEIIAIDSDIKDTTLQTQPSLLQKDSTRQGLNTTDINNTSQVVPPLVNLRNIPKPKINIDKKYLKLLPKLLIPFFAIIILGGFAYYKFVPFVKVRIFVAAKPVSIEKVFTGDPNIQSVDFDNLKIPIKTEETTKSLSDSVTATGKAFKGEKATGSIRVTYQKGASGCTDAVSKIQLNSGQIVKSTNRSYKLVGSAELICNAMTDIGVQAADVGEEYNIPANNFFTIDGYPQSEVYGLNSTGFTGGTKQEYTVLSQTDVNGAVDSLSGTAIEEVKNELREKNEGWDIIENTIKSEVDKTSIKTDIPVGTEATNANIQLTIKGTATYYLTKDLNEKLTDLLRVEALEQNLFESNNNLELVLGDNIKKDLSVDETSTNKDIKIKLKAEANIKPAVDKAELENTLKSMKWNDGLNYLGELNYAAQTTEVEFKPDGFPEFLRYFPSKQGGILITVIELQSKD